MIGIVTFADSGLHRSLSRFESQARALDIFDVISVNSERNLSDDYIDLHRQRMFKGSRGFGYWCWKPHVILKTLENNPTLTVLFYSDAGCHLRVEGRHRLLEYVRALETSQYDLLAFEGAIDGAALLHDGRPLPDLTEAHWTKGDMFAEFGLQQGHPSTLSPQFGAGIFAVKNTSEIRNWLKEWSDLTSLKPHLFDDTTSVAPNHSGFVAGRHDQSYFSLAAKRRGAVRFSAFEYWYPERTPPGNNIFEAKPDWAAIYNCPFHARRDKPVARWRAWLRRINRHLRNAIAN